MAKRIISDAIIESDAFIDMSHQAQVLYLHMIMNADDEGFVDKTKRLMRLYNINEIALQELITNKFIIHFENVNVIKHWLIHNIIRKDRMHPTTWQDEKRKLTIRDGIYHLDDNMLASCGQNAGKLLTNGNDNEYVYDIEYDNENEKEIKNKEKEKETELVGGDEAEEKTKEKIDIWNKLKQMDQIQEEI